MRLELNLLLALCVGVRVELSVSAIRSLRAEQEDCRKRGSHEDGDKVEAPLPAQRCRNLSDQNGSEEGASKDCQVGKGHAHSSLVDKVHVANGSVEQAFIGSGADTLKDSSAEQAAVVCPRGPGPGTRGNDDEDSQEEEMALAPDAGGGNEEDGSSAGAEKKVARQESDFGKGLCEETGERDGVCGQDGAERRGEDAGPAEGEGDEIALP